MAVEAGAQGGTFVPGTPDALFQTHSARGTNKPQYDVSRDGHFLIDTDLQDATTGHPRAARQASAEVRIYSPPTL
jgi:hypothetical protein